MDVATGIFEEPQGQIDTGSNIIAGDNIRFVIRDFVNNPNALN